MVRPHLLRGDLVALFPDWSGERSGGFLYHTSRHQPPAALQAFIDFLERRRDESELWLG